MGIKEMITNLQSSWFLKKFSLSVLQQMYERSVENMHIDVGV